MATASLRRRLRDSFAATVFAWVAAALLGVLAVGVALVVDAQRRLLTEHLLERGGTLARLVAQGARLGVFVEDPQALAQAAAAVAREPEVLAVAVHAADGRRLWLSGGERGDRHTTVPPPAGFEDLGGARRFWAPVLADPELVGEEALYFRAEPHPGAPAQVIGYAAVVLSEDELARGLAEVLGQSLLVGILLLVLGMALTYRVVRESARPLEHLLADLRARGVAGEGEGDLRGTFTGVVQALDQAVAEVQTLNRELEARVAERTAELQAARDGLEVKVAERTGALERTHRQLLQAEKLAAVGKLSASIAHEFNNPIFAVRNVVQGLGQDPGIASENRELAALAVGECDRMAALIRNLQSFNRPTSGVVARVDLNGAAHAMLQLCRRDFAGRGVRVETALAPGLAPVWAVEDQVKQVLLNLLRNAGDAMPSGGTVRVGTEDRGPEVALTVADTGVGMSPAVVSRLFEPFFSTKAAVKGTGLGLSVSYGIVQGHGGRIEVESQPGEGSSFTVILPKERREP